ncbi:hypothetical protein [Nonomuraea sp. NPDC050786]|uniref:hypothetical protein n=1 Tax=Nonomuraea sp. NPDC050786 TaxID=3154840 RepID=UPI0033D3166E
MGNQRRGGNGSGKQGKHSDGRKAEAVEWLIISGRPAAQITRELGVDEYTLCNCLNMAKKRGQVENAEKPLTAEERAQPKELREENRRLKMEREIPEKAAVWFAKESL